MQPSPGDQVSLNPQPIPPGLVAITAAVAIAMAAALGAWGSFGDNGDFGDYWPVLIIIAIVAAIVFGLVVPRAVSGAWPAARTGLILSVLGLLTVAVFWSGAPPIFAFAGILLGYLARQRGETGVATAAVVVGTLALVADIAIYIGDQA
jgi:asparagine N-glycosylation enzyme membrane subunit Stt3